MHSTSFAFAVLLSGVLSACRLSGFPLFCLQLFRRCFAVASLLFVFLIVLLAFCCIILANVNKRFRLLKGRV